MRNGHSNSLLEQLQSPFFSPPFPYTTLANCLWQVDIVAIVTVQSRNNIFHWIWTSVVQTISIDERMTRKCVFKYIELMAGWVIKTLQRLLYLDISIRQKQGRAPRCQKWFISFDRAVYSVIYNTFFFFHLILSKSYNGTQLTCANDISCNWKKLSDSTGMLAWISVLRMAI